MIPTTEVDSVYLGDIYILQDDTIIGMVRGINLRRYPRLLLKRFSSPSDDSAAKSPPPSATTASQTPSPVVGGAPDPPTARPPLAIITPPKEDETSPVDSNSTAARALELVAKEAGMEVTDLQDLASFANLGVDSLMSLVIAEKFRQKLGVVVRGSLFLEYPTVGDQKSWLLEYYT